MDDVTKTVRLVRVKDYRIFRLRTRSLTIRRVTDRIISPI